MGAQKTVPADRWVTSTGEWDDPVQPGKYIPGGQGNRILIRFDTERYRIGKGWTESYGYRGSQRFRDAVLLEYVVTEGTRTPSRGVFTAHRLTIRTRDGRVWYGQMKEGTNIVKMRLAPPVTVPS